MEFNVKLSGEIENEFEVWINVERVRGAGGWDRIGSDHLEAGVVAGDGQVARVAGAGGGTQPRHRPHHHQHQQQGGGGHHGTITRTVSSCWCSLMLPHHW